LIILLKKIKQNFEIENIKIEEPQPHYAWDIENDKEIINNKENAALINDEVLRIIKLIMILNLQ